MMKMTPRLQTCCKEGARIDSLQCLYQEHETHDSKRNIRP